jgi:hypothetical protein
MPDFAVRFDP